MTRNIFRDVAGFIFMIIVIIVIPIFLINRLINYYAESSLLINQNPSKVQIEEISYFKIPTNYKYLNAVLDTRSYINLYVKVIFTKKELSLFLANSKIIWKLKKPDINVYGINDSSDLSWWKPDQENISNVVADSQTMKILEGKYAKKIWKGIILVSYRNDDEVVVYVDVSIVNKDQKY
jgi:hypothetical protein